jgi:acyl-CoA synthetase (AMP-forming)/AMP-acid ligase II
MDLSSPALIAPAAGVDEPSLWQPLDRNGGRADLLVTWDGKSDRGWSWDEWHRSALRCAGGLRRLGVEPGDRVACLLTNSADASAGLLGVWFAGGCVLSLPLIARGMQPATYLAQLRTIVSRAEPTLFVCDASVRSFVAEADLKIAIVTFAELAGGAAGDPTPPPDTAPAFVQFSSGSTSEPRGCVLTPRAIARQLAMLERNLGIDPDRDTTVGWLPLSHDMGLFGCLLLTYWTGHRLVMSKPERFLTNPSSWLQDCARFQATLSGGPNFALDLAVRAAQRQLPAPFPMRGLVIGGERVEPGTLRRANAVLGDERLKMSALLPAYGLAEAVLAVTMTPKDEGPLMLEFCAEALAAGEVGPARSGASQTVALASVGRPLPGNDVRIAPPGQIGEIVVRSPSLAEGYLDDPDSTAERFTDAGLLTGDLGFVRDGHLFVTGRVDDLISVAGRNIYARDIELAIARVPGVRHGGCAVVDMRHGSAPRLVALIELGDAPPDLALVAERIRDSARRTAGVTISACVFVPRGGLPKTPSGKLQRFRCQQLAIEPPDGSLTVAT